MDNEHQQTGRLDKVASQTVKEPFDIIVIGGGIYGAAVFWEAASRGTRVLLLEKDDFGHGTSANTLKLINGGINALRTLNIPAVRRFSKERNILTRIAPHLIRPVPCLMPTDNSWIRNRWVIGSAVTAYHWLDWDRNRKLDDERYYGDGHILDKHFTKTVLRQIELPLSAAVTWYEGMVYLPERLVLAFIKSGMEKGGQALNYATVRRLQVDQGQVKGVHYECGGDFHFAEAGIVIDCSGPWVDETMANYRQYTRRQRFGRAVNLVVNQSFADYAITVRTSRQTLYIIPWRNASIIGTWYLEDDGPAVGKTDVDKFIIELQSHVSGLHINRADVSLIHEGRVPFRGKSGNRLTQKPLICHAGDRTGGPNGLFMVQGAHMTMARAAAVNVLDQVQRRGMMRLGESISHEQPLYGGEIDDVRDFLQSHLDEYTGQYGEETILRLFRVYGAKMTDILQVADRNPDWAGPIPGVEDSLCAELSYVMENEMVATLADLILRRTDLGNLGRPADETLQYCAHLLAKYLKWSASETKLHIQAVQQHYPQWYHQIGSRPNLEETILLHPQS